MIMCAFFYNKQFTLKKFLSHSKRGKRVIPRPIAKSPDFGCARDISDIQFMTCPVGTEWYMSREMERMRFSQVANNDIYSLGVSVKEMKAGIKECESDLENDFNKIASEELKDFVACTMKSASERPSAQKLLKHKWLKKSWTEHIRICLKVSNK